MTDNDATLTNIVNTKLTGKPLLAVRVGFVLISLALLYLVGNAYVTGLVPSMQNNTIGVEYDVCPEKPDCYQVSKLIPGSLGDRSTLEIGMEIININNKEPELSGINGGLELIYLVTVVDEEEDTGEKKIRMVRDPSQVNLIEMGLTYLQSATVILFTNNLVLFVSVGVGFYLAARQWDDWMVLVAAMGLIALGTLMSDYYYWNLNTDTFISAVSLYHFIFMAIVGVLFLLLVPDGRMFPEKGWILLVIVFIFNLPIYGEDIENIFYLVATFGSFLAVIGAQIYRYIKLSNQEQRQQIKWILYGSLVAILIRGTAEISWLLLASGPDSTLGIKTYTVITDVISQLGLLIFPIAILFSAMRYRLWDIDAAINRTLVYGILTLVMGLVFSAGFFGLQAILAALMGSGQVMLSAGVAGAAVVSLFTPTRTRVRVFIDRNVYGIELDYEQAIKEYNRQAAQLQKKADTQSGFGEYQNMVLLGRGGMGEVYKGTHPKFEQPVAIKLLPESLADDEEMLSRFKREAETIQKLDHPNIVSLLAMGDGDGDGKPYMVMDFIPGINLSEYLNQNGPMYLDEALPLLREVADALDYAHGDGIIHRDIKPSNVMVSTDIHGKNSATLMDFGLAKLASSRTQLTQTGGMMGTLDYISPEQIRGDENVGAMADQYSFAVMTYKLLVGAAPFQRDLPVLTIMAHMNEPAPNAHDKMPDLSEKTGFTIMRGMAKYPEARFETVGEFVEALV